MLSGANDLLYKGQASLAITPNLIAGFVGEPLINIEMLACAAANHPLNQLNRELTFTDLRQHRQLVVRDSGSLNQDAGWLDADQRWTFSHSEASLDAALAGLGFAWYPLHLVEHHLASGKLKELSLAQGKKRYGQLYLIYANNDLANQADLELGKQLLSLAKISNL